MLAVLREIRARTNDDNPWQGDAKARRLAKQLAELPADAPINERFPILTALGEELVLLGREREGLAHLQTVEDMMPALRPLIATDAEAEFSLHFGAAWLRLAETENCCARNAPESCILPLAGAALHERKEGSGRAMALFARAMDLAPADSPIAMEARWLLNVAAMTLGAYPDGVQKERRISPSWFAPDEDFPHFDNVAKRLGVATFGLAGGVVADDLDNDGDVDLLVSNSDESGQLRLFRNQGDGTFVDETKSANLEGILGGLNMVQADYDNDGFVDVLLLRGAWFGAGGRQPASLLHNQRDGTFVDVTFDAGLGDARFPTQTATWADFDGDGWIDVFVGGEATNEVRSPCRLYHNNHDGTFTDRAAAAGVQTFAFVKSVCAGDYDGDGFPDIYVSILGGKNRLYRNRRDGTFEDVAEKLGVSLPIMSFGAFFWDFDQDGVLDLFVAAYPAPIADVASAATGRPFQCELPRLYRGDGKGGFTEMGRAANFVKPTSPMGHNFGDLDNDGFPDLYLATGAPLTRAIMPNLMYRNVGGRRFADVTLLGGFGSLQKGHAVAFADFDEDGDLDVFTEMGGGFLGDKAYDCLFENPGFGNHWLAVRLEGRTSNRSAIGATIRADIVDAGVRRSVYRTVNSGGTFGANPLRQHLGLGKATKVETLTVTWPTTGKSQTFRDVAADQIIELVEGEARPTARPPKPQRLGGRAEEAK
jgi:hypothetical protein